MADERNRELERAAAAGDPAARAALSQARGREGEAAAFTPWRRLRDAGADLFAPVELNTGLAGLLGADLAPLGAERAARARRFVIDGSGPALLDELAADAEAQTGFRAARPRDPGETRPRDVLCALREPWPLIRLGLLYDALLARDRDPRREALLAQLGFPRWLTWLVREAERRTALPGPHGYPLRMRPTCGLAWHTLRDVARAARLSEAGLEQVLLDHDGTQRRLQLDEVGEILGGCPGLSEALVSDHADGVRQALRQSGPSLAAVCELLIRHGVPTAPFAEELAAAATDSSSGHHTAWPLVDRGRKEGAARALRTALEGRLRHPQAEVRWQAVRCLEHFAPAKVIPTLEHAAVADRSKRVRRLAEAAVTKLRAVAPAASARGAGADLAPLSAAVRSQLDQALAREGIPGEVRASACHWLADPSPWGATAQPRVLFGVLGRLVEGAGDEADDHVERLAPLADLLDLSRRLRLLRLTGHLTAELTPLGLAVCDRLTRAPCGGDLQRLASALPSADLDPALPGRTALSPRTLSSAFAAAAGWDGRAYYAQRPELIEEALRGGLTATAGVQVWAQRLLTELEGVLCEQPALQPGWLEALVDLGTDTPKAKREFAQRVVDHHRVALWPLLEPQLQARKGDRRANAARWLGRRGERAALPALREAVVRERSAKVKPALEEALAALA